MTIRRLFTSVLITVALSLGLLTGSAAADTTRACVQHGSGNIYVVEPGASCKKNDRPIELSTGGSSANSSLILSERWNETSSIIAGAWTPVAGSHATATVGGGPLSVEMNLSLTGGSHGTCRPTVDGVWAGDYSGQTKSATDPFWTEGLVAVGCCGGGFRGWTTSKVYTNIPPGTHAFAIECATDGGRMLVNSSPEVFSTWSVIELPPTAGP